MNSKQKRNLLVAYIVLFSIIIWGAFFNENKKYGEETFLSSKQINILSNSLVSPSESDILSKDVEKENDK